MCNQTWLVLSLYSKRLTAYAVFFKIVAAPMNYKLTVFLSALLLSGCYAVQRSAPKYVYYAVVPNAQIVYPDDTVDKDTKDVVHFRGLDRKVPFRLTVYFPENKDTAIAIEVGSSDTTHWSKSPVTVDCSVARIEIGNEKFAPVQRQNVTSDNNWYKWCDTQVTLFGKTSKPEYLATITFEPGKLLGESFHVVLPSIDGAAPIRVKYVKKIGVSTSSGTY